jgi:hypothetical protein
MPASLFRTIGKTRPPVLVPNPGWSVAVEPVPTLAWTIRSGAVVLARMSPPGELAQPRGAADTVHRDTVHRKAVHRKAVHRNACSERPAG